MLSAFWLLLALGYLVHGLVSASRAQPRAAAAAPSAAGDSPPCEELTLGQIFARSRTERMVEIPESVLNQISESLARLEVLERREQMRLVQRADRKRADTGGRL